MRIFTIITSKDPGALQQFAQTCVDCGASGVTVFARPDLVAPTVPPGQPTLQELETKADEAAARKDYREAARISDQITALRQDLADQAKQGALWVRDALDKVRDKTQLVVLGNIHWPADVEFTPKNFFARIEEISTTLLTTGVGGIVQQTPLLKRTYIPLAASADKAVVADGSAARGEPASSGADPLVESPARHPLLPATLTQRQVAYATYRLGLDKQGLRRSKQEAGNLMGLSPASATRMENDIARLWPSFETKINENDALSTPAPTLTTP
jgi:hypothetical protein